MGSTGSTTNHFSCTMRAVIMIFAAVLTSGVSSLKFPSFMAPIQRELTGNNRQPTIRDESGFVIPSAPATSSRVHIPRSPPQPQPLLLSCVRALIPPLKVIGAAALSLTLITPPVMAESSQVIGSIAGSGLVFKDTLTIESFKDPKVRTGRFYNKRQLKH